MAGGGMNQSQSGGGTAQNISQLTQLLQKMGSQGQGAGGAGSAFPMMSNMGNAMMQAGRPPMPQPSAVAQRPMTAPGGPGVPVAPGASPQMGAPGQMTGGMGMPGDASMGMNPAQMNMLLARQNGLMG